MAPAVSIGMPVFNEQLFLRDALDSLLAQEFRDFDILVADNASTDGTPEILREYAARDRRLVIHRHPRNVGAVANFQFVVAPAQAPLFMWASGDDIWSPRFLTLLVEELGRHPEAGLAMGAVERRREDARPMDVVRFTGKDDPNRRGRYAMLKGVTSPRKYNLFMYGLFRTDLARVVARSIPDTLAWDRHLICQVALATRIRYVDEVVQIKRYRAANAESYRAQDRTRFQGVHRRQLQALARVILSSPAIPGRLKLLAPVAVLRYGLMILTKPYAPRAWPFVSATLNADGLPMSQQMRFALLGGLIAAVLPLALVAVAPAALPFLALALLELLVGLGALGAYRTYKARDQMREQMRAVRSGQQGFSDLLESTLGQLRESFAAVRSEQQGFSDLQKSTLGQVRESLAAVRSEQQGFSDLQKSTLGQVRESLAAVGSQQQGFSKLQKAALGQVRESFAAVQSGQHNLSELQKVALGKMRELVAGRIDGVGREIRYLTDLLLDGDQRPMGEKGNLLARYALQRQQKHSQVVAFVRHFEESRIRELYLQEIFPEVRDIEAPVGAVNELTGHANKADMLFVCAVARLRKARRIFEFGTYLGRTTYHLTSSSDGAVVTTLNLPPESDHKYGAFIGRYFKGTPREAHIRQIFSDSKLFDTAPYRGQFDFVFVDGDHGYESVENDTRKAFELLAPGGVILWHDYAPKSPGLVHFFRDFTQGTPLFRIKRTCLLMHVDGVDPLSFTPHPMGETLEQEAYDADPYLIEELYHV